MPGKNYVIAILVDATDKDSKQVLGRVEDNIEGVADSGEKAGKRLSVAFTGAAMAMAFGQAIPLMKNSIKLFTQMRAGLVGLQSVVRYTGQDWGQAKAELQAYVVDGLVPMTDATVSLKNLLLRGFGLEEAVEIMQYFKDFAAFGRQGALTMGEAIRGATEGLKNMNPILVDNVGLTKNMSIMYKDYAKSIGTTAAKLTDTQRLEAELMGIRTEGASVVGNAIKLQGELGGAMAASEAKTRRLKEAIGGALAPAYGDLLKSVSPVLEAAIAFTELNPKTVATLLGGAGLVAAIAALAAAYALMGPGGAIVVGITAAVVALGATVAHLKSQFAPTNSEIVTAAERHGELRRQVEALRDEYIELEGKPDKSAEEHERLDRVMTALIEHVPEAAQAFDAEGKAIDLNLSSLDAYIGAKEILRQYYVEMLEDRQTESNIRVAESGRLVTLALGALNAKTGEYIQKTEAAVDTQEEFADATADASANIHDQRMQEVYASMSAEDLRRVIVDLSIDLRDADVASKQIAEQLKNLKGEVDATGEATDKTKVKVKEVTDAFVDWNEQLEYFRFLYGGLIPIMDEIPGEMGEMAQYMQDYWQQHEKAAEDAVAAQRDYGDEVRRSMSRWGDWVDFMVHGLDLTADTLATTVGMMVGIVGTGTDGMRQLFDDFFRWLWMMIIKTVIKMLIVKAVMAMFGGGASGGTIGEDIIGEVGGFGDARHGGIIRGTVPSIDSVWIRGMPGELVTSVPLTRRLENLVSDWETGRGPRPALAGADIDGYSGPPAEEHYHFHTSDFSSFDRALRGGRLGRAIDIAMRHGRLRR